MNKQISTQLIQKKERGFVNRILCPTLPSQILPRDIRYVKLVHSGHVLLSESNYSDYPTTTFLKSVFILLTRDVIIWQISKRLNYLNFLIPQSLRDIILNNSVTIGSFFPTKDPKSQHLCSNFLSAMLDMQVLRSVLSHNRINIFTHVFPNKKTKKIV